MKPPCGQLGVKQVAWILLWHAISLSCCGGDVVKSNSVSMMLGGAVRFS